MHSHIFSGKEYTGVLITQTMGASGESQENLGRVSVACRVTLGILAKMCTVGFLVWVFSSLF